MQMLPLLRHARGLRDDCTRLGLEAIERPEERPGFHALFRDLYAFARGVGNPERVTVLARSLARLSGVALVNDDSAHEEGREEGTGTHKNSTDRTALLQEEAVWQGAAGAFVRRCREEYGEAYVDVVTGICDAVEVTRLGLRILAAACACGTSAGGPANAAATAVDPLARLQGTLLSFPYPCSEGLTAVAGDGSGHDLGETLQMTLGPEGLDSVVGDMGGAGQTGGASGAQHIMLLQVRFPVFFSIGQCLPEGGLT